MNGMSPTELAGSERQKIDLALTNLTAEAAAIQKKLDQLLEKSQSNNPPNLDVVTTELGVIKSKLDGFNPNEESSKIPTWLRALGVVGLALFTGWWSSYLTSQTVADNTLRQKIAEHAGEGYLEARRLVDRIETDLESFCLDTHQSTTEADSHAAKFRGLIDGGPFPERVNDSLRAFNNYVQETMALRMGSPLSPEDRASIRRETRRLRTAAVESLRSWAGQ